MDTVDIKIEHKKKKQSDKVKSKSDNIDRQF